MDEKSVLILPARRYASDVLAMARCLSVCLSQVDVLLKGRIELVLGMEASFNLSCIMFQGNSGIYKNKGRPTSLRTVS